MAEVTGYIPGMGTHHVRGGMTPAMMADPSFDRLDPILDSVGLDDVFQPANPRCSSSTARGRRQARRVRLLRPHPTGLPPRVPREQRLVAPPPDDLPPHDRRRDGRLQHRQRECASLGGVNVNLSNYYMLHVWVLEDMKFIPDVFAGMMPCITGAPRSTTQRPLPHHEGTAPAMSHDMTPKNTPTWADSVCRPRSFPRRTPSDPVATSAVSRGTVEA